MITFGKLWDKLNESHDLETSEMKAIKTGLNIRKDFWDDFMSLLNDRSHLAALLDVSPDKIAGWSSRIKENLEKVEGENDDEAKKTKILDTGLF